MKKKILSIILSLVMVLTVIPFAGLTSFAAYDLREAKFFPAGDDTVPKTENLKKYKAYVIEMTGGLDAVTEYVMAKDVDTIDKSAKIHYDTACSDNAYGYEQYVLSNTSSEEGSYALDIERDDAYLVVYYCSDTPEVPTEVYVLTANSFLTYLSFDDLYNDSSSWKEYSEPTPQPATHTHNNLEFTPWGSGEGESTSLPTKTGNYYLTSDIKLNGAYTPAAGVSINICLDGHVIQQINGKSPVIKFMNAAEVNIYDCNTVAKHYFKEDDTGLWVLQSTSDGADHTVTGGVLTGGKNLRKDSGAAIDYGGGVCIRNGVAASFGLNGGTICGNTAYYGGGIYNKESGTVTITNGAVCGNTATTIGGGIMTEGKVLLNAAEGKEIVVTDNVATLGHGGILNYDAEMHISGKITVKDNVCDKKITETVTYPKNLSTSVPLIVDGALTGSEIYITHAELESDHHDGLVLTNGYLTKNPEADLNTFFKYDGPYSMFLNNDSELEISEENVTEWHLENKICDSFNGKGGLMARQGLRDKNAGTVSSTEGRSVIALTQEQIDSISEAIIVTGSDGSKSVKQVIDCVYTYFYNGDTKVEADGLKNSDGKPIAAFIIIDNTGAGSEKITGYGYYRLYDKTTGTFLFDTLYAAPANK